MFGVPSPDQLVDDTSEAAGDAVIGLANTVYPNVGSTGTESDDSSTSSSGAEGTYSYGSGGGNEGGGETYLQTGEDASGQSWTWIEDGYGDEGQDTPDNTPDAGETMWQTGDEGETTTTPSSDPTPSNGNVADDSAPSNANGSTPNSPNSDVSIPALGIAGMSTSTMAIGAFVLVGVLVVAAGALGGDGSTGGTTA